MDVTWRIEPTEGGCRVSIEHDFRRPIGLPIVGPLLGDETFPRLVDRLFTRPIAGRTLATFRVLAEALVADIGPTIESGPVPIRRIPCHDRLTGFARSGGCGSPASA